MKTCIIPSRLDNRRMNIADQHKKAVDFIKHWQGRGDEKQETQKFWLDLMQNVLDVPDVLVANLHNELEKQYADPDSEEEHHSLALLTVRIVFCLYA